MRIAIDAAGPLSSTEKGGISYSLGDFLSALKDADRENEYLIFGYFWRNYREKKRKISIPEAGNFKLRTLPLPRKIVKNIEERMHLSVIEQFLQKEHISVFHSISAQEMPYLKRIKSVYAIYDLACELKPEWYKDRWYSHVRQSALRANIIITTSYATKRDIVRIYGIDPGKIRVVYLGVNREIFNTGFEETDDVFASDYGLPERYFLTVATSVERKNIPMLLKAYGGLLKKGRKEKLVVVAGSQIVKEEIAALVRALGMENNVFCFCEIPTENLACFYRRAVLFVFPSLYEGFGLPVLEAMACGCPVVLSSVSSLPEIAGEAGIMVDPYNVDEIVSAVEKVLSDVQLREDMKKKGLVRAKDFSWEKTARETLNIYKEVYEGT